MSKKKSLNVFVSYSHMDKKFKNEFLQQMKSLEWTHNINVWHDGEILAGENIDEKVLAQLNKSDVVLLLVSPNFLASHYCINVELKKAIERHKAKECIVVPVILQKSNIDETLSFSSLMRVPEDGRPIQSYKPKNNGYVDAVSRIKQMINSTFKNAKKTDVVEPLKPIAIDIYQDGKLKPYVLDNHTWETIITIKDRLTDFQKISTEKLIKSVIDYKKEFNKAKKEKNMNKFRNDYLKNYILELSATTRQWLFKDVGVRIHFRILNKKKNSYVGFVVVDGKANCNITVNYSKKITPMSSTSGMIYHSSELDAALIKSKNQKFHDKGKNDDIYVDYVTTSLKLKDLCNTPNPLMSMGISIEKEFNKRYAPYLIALVFLNFDKTINDLITIFCSEISKIDKDFKLNVII